MRQVNNALPMLLQARQSSQLEQIETLSNSNKSSIYDLNNSIEIDKLSQQKKSSRFGSILYLDANKADGYGVPTNEVSGRTTVWKDLSGYGSDATLNGFAYDATSGWANEIIDGNTMYYKKYDGVNDYDSIVSISNLDIPYAPFAIGITFRIDSTVSCGILALETTGNITDAQYALRWSSSGKAVVLYLNGAAVCSTSSDTIIAGNWYNLVYIWKGGKVHYYINLVRKSEAQLFDSKLTSKANLNIGKAITGSAAFKGDIASVTMYVFYGDDQIVLDFEKSVCQKYITTIDNHIFKNFATSLPEIRKSTNDFAFTNTNDVHWGVGETTSILDSVEASSILAKYCSIDTIVCNGDLIMGNEPKYDSLNEITEVINALKYNTTLPILVSRGNHDTNDFEQTDKDYFITNKEWYDTVIAETNDGSFVLENKNGYYYKNFEAKKIRVIVANTTEINEINGVIQDYPNHIYSGIKSASQLNWLINDALKVPNDWHVIVIMHLTPKIGTYNHNYGIEMPWIVEILESFIAGTSGSYNESGVSCSWDFTDQGEGNLVGCFSGHVHDDCHLKENGVNYFISTNTTPSKKYTESPSRSFNDEDTLSMNVFIVDTTTKTMKIVKVGSKGTMITWVGNTFTFTY